MASATSSPVIESSGTFTIGDMPVYRLGYGAMQITGKGIWGPPRDEAECLRVLKRAIELGVNLIDTSDNYNAGQTEATVWS